MVVQNRLRTSIVLSFVVYITFTCSTYNFKSEEKVLRHKILGPKMIMRVTIYSSSYVAYYIVLLYGDNRNSMRANILFGTDKITKTSAKILNIERKVL